MSEEEKKAIEYVKAQRGVYYKICINLIEKQQKEIENIKTNIRDTIRDLEEEQYVEYDGMVQDFIDTLKDLY